MILGIHKPQLYRALEKGDIPTIEAGGRRMIIREGLEEAWENRSRRRVQAPTSEQGKQRQREQRQRREQRQQQAIKAQPKAQPKAQALAPSPAPGGEDWPEPPGEWNGDLPQRPATTPNLEEERAWVEYEKRYKLARENKVAAGELIYKQDALTAYNAIFARMLNRAHDAARQIQLQVPGLTHDSTLIIEKIVLNIFEETAQDEFSELAK